MSARQRSRAVPHGLLDVLGHDGELHVVDRIVRSPSGKPDYRWAKALAEAGGAASQGEPAAWQRSGSRKAR